MQTKQKLDTFHSRKMIFYNFSVCSTFGRSICYSLFSIHKNNNHLFRFSLLFVSLSFFFSVPFALRVYSRCIVNLLTTCRVFIHCIFISHCSAVYHSYASAQFNSVLALTAENFLISIVVCVQMYNNSAHTFACQPAVCACV